MKNRTSSAYRRQSPAMSWFRWAAAAGLAVAVALTSWVDTARHAALVKSAARPLSNGQKLSPDFILACGFAATWSWSPRPCSSSLPWPRPGAPAA